VATASPKGAPAGAPFASPLLGREVAILIGDGSDDTSIALVQKVLRAAGARTVLVGHRAGPISTTDGTHRTALTVFDTDAASFDAVVIPGGDATALVDEPQAVDFVGDACGLDRPVAAIGGGRAVVAAAGAAGASLFRGDDTQVMRVTRQLVTALALGRQWERELGGTVHA
jgi:putative intracellular protease/amidase